MTAAETIAKLEAMRRAIAPVTGRGLLKDTDVSVLARAVDVLTYVVIDQLREPVMPSPGVTIELADVRLDGSVDLSINGQFRHVEVGELVIAWPS